MGSASCRPWSSLLPKQVRARFRGLSTHGVIATALKLRPAHYVEDVHVFTAMTALKAIARRVGVHEDEAVGHEKAIRQIVSSWRPDLLALTGVGPIVAATVLAAWSHAGRCHDDAAFAMLAGTAPIPASSGTTVRYRLNRSGDRQLNRAIYTIVITRLRRDPATRVLRPQHPFPSAKGSRFTRRQGDAPMTCQGPDAVLTRAVGRAGG